MGGYLASTSGWERFEHFAGPILREQGIECLHAVDFQRSKGEFKGWSGHRKSNLVQRLYNELAESKVVGLTFSALKGVYNDRRSDLRVNQQLSAYGFCFNALINSLVRQKNIQALIEEHGCAILVESGNKHDGDLQRLFEVLSNKYERFPRLFPGLSFVKKRSCVAVQMADFLAYHDRRQMLAAHEAGDHGNPPPDAPAMVIAKRLIPHGQIIATDFYADPHKARHARAAARRRPNEGS